MKYHLHAALESGGQVAEIPDISPEIPGAWGYILPLARAFIVNNADLITLVQERPG
jgi:hypothetical protein